MMMTWLRRKALYAFIFVSCAIAIACNGYVIFRAWGM
jgi:hypothetical protein